MRNIKFRGKRIDNGEWVYGSLLIGFTGITYIIPMHDHILGMTEMHEVHPETVGQFTGLKDKNGNEIYEGDIIQFYDGAYFAVKYYPTKCAYGLDGVMRHMDFLAALYDTKLTEIYTDKMVVIGSVHDTPELLTQNKEK